MLIRYKRGIYNADSKGTNVRNTFTVSLCSSPTQLNSPLSVYSPCLSLSLFCVYLSVPYRTVCWLHMCTLCLDGLDHWSALISKLHVGMVLFKGSISVSVSVCVCAVLECAHYAGETTHFHSYGTFADWHYGIEGAGLVWHYIEYNAAKSLMKTPSVLLSFEKHWENEVSPTIFVCAHVCNV